MKKLLSILVVAVCLIFGSGLFYIWYITTFSKCLNEEAPEVKEIKVKAGDKQFIIKWKTDKKSVGEVFLYGIEKNGSGTYIGSFDDLNASLEKPGNFHTVLIPTSFLSSGKLYRLEVFSSVPCEDKFVGFTTITNFTCFNLAYNNTTAHQLYTIQCPWDSNFKKY